MKDHETPVMIDMAFAWQYGRAEHMAGLKQLADSDIAPSSITVWHEHGYLLDGQHPDQVPAGFVTLQVEGTNVRTEIRPAAARRLARLLDEVADEIDPDHQDELEDGAA